MLVAGKDWQEHLGWGQDRYLLADIYDAQRDHSEWSIQWKKQPNFPPHPARPKAKSTPVEQTAPGEKKQPGRIASLWKSLQPR